LESHDAEFREGEENSYAYSRNARANLEEAPRENALFRIYFKLHNRSSPEDYLEFYIEADSESAALERVLQSSESPSSFGSVTVTKLDNATIVNWN
jgi:hypothetical protein